MGQRVRLYLLTPSTSRAAETGAFYTFSQSASATALPPGIGQVRPDTTLSGFVGGLVQTLHSPLQFPNDTTYSFAGRSFPVGGGIVIQFDSVRGRMQADGELTKVANSVASTTNSRLGTGRSATSIQMYGLAQPTSTIACLLAAPVSTSPRRQIRTQPRSPARMGRPSSAAGRLSRARTWCRLRRSSLGSTSAIDLRIHPVGVLVR